MQSPANLHAVDCCMLENVGILFAGTIEALTAQIHRQTLLTTLHWLPIQACIEYKLSILCHSFFSETAPVYLSDLLHVYSPSRQLHSFSDSRTLRILHIKRKTFGHRSFSYAALSVRNSLPRKIRHIQSPLHIKLNWRHNCSNPTSACWIPSSSTFFCKLLYLTCCGVCVSVCVCTKFQFV